MKGGLQERERERQSEGWSDGEKKKGGKEALQTGKMSKRAPCGGGTGVGALYLSAASPICASVSRLGWRRATARLLPGCCFRRRLRRHGPEPGVKIDLRERPRVSHHHS